MIIDSSVVVALYLREPDYEKIVARLGSAERLAIGAPTLVEIGMVIGSRTGRDGRALTERFLVDFEVEVIEFGADHWREALDAFRRYGKGRHPASLNYGDCLAYAIASLSGEPLFCRGDDFGQTDLDIVN